MNTTPQAPSRNGGIEETGFGTAYVEFARTLRTWFVAYGVGAPVLVLSQDTLATKVAAAGSGRAIAVAFLLGAALQILQAILYKIAMWYLYMAQLYPERRDSPAVKRSEAIAEALWLELAFDGLTLLAFGWATVQLAVIATG
jgi:hypothetical protein